MKTEEQEEDEGPISVGRLKIGERYQVEEESSCEKTELRVGRLKKDIWGSERGDLGCGDQVKLRGARKITKGKTERKENQLHCDALKKNYHKCWSFHFSEKITSGNRISCLIENLHSDKKEEGEEEEEEEEELKLGRRKLSVHFKMCTHDLQDEIE